MVMVAHLVNILKMELYTLNGYIPIVWYVNYVSVCCF